MTNPVLRPHHNPQARVRLLCVPHAGAAASMYAAWAALLPPRIELCAVQLPGREDRMNEPMPGTLAELVAEVVDALAAERPLPIAVFGHSSGAVVAFELARMLEQAGVPVALLIASCCFAPGVPLPSPRLCEMPDAALVAELRKLNSMPEFALRNLELMELVLPRIRADDALVTTHRSAAPVQPPAVLRAPITAIGGLADAAVQRHQLAGWCEHTSGGFALYMVPGDHFYLTADPAAAASLVAAEVDRTTTGARLAALLSDVCGAPISALGPDAAPGSTPGWDSVATVAFVTAIEHELGVAISTREALRVRSLGDFVTLVTQKAAG